MHVLSAPADLSRFDPYTVNVDLHCHSDVSDGVLAPESVIERAASNGVAWIALTDHDEISGVARAAQRAGALGIGFIAGVEVSATWAGKTVHIVGLGVDIEHPALVAGLALVRAGRIERAQRIGAALERAGIPGAYDGAMRYAGNPDLISRSHFARYIVESGACDDMRDVFGRYLVEGKPGYVEHRWARMKDAVAWINAAGGEAVVAHPARYRFNELELPTFIEEFIAAGGVGLEVLTSAHTRDEVKRFANIARDYGLRASRGSDFHSPTESRVDLGGLPPLPDSVVPIWAAWGIG